MLLVLIRLRIHEQQLKNGKKKQDIKGEGGHHWWDEKVERKTDGEEAKMEKTR